jgi:hypothetical protein
VFALDRSAVHSSCYSATVRSSGVRQAAHHARALLPMGLELAAPHTPARRRVPVRGRGGRGSIQRRQGTRHSSTGDRRACGTARMPHRVAAGGPSWSCRSTFQHARRRGGWRRERDAAIDARRQQSLLPLASGVGRVATVPVIAAAACAPQWDVRPRRRLGGVPERRCLRRPQFGGDRGDPVETGTDGRAEAVRLGGACAAADRRAVALSWAKPSGAAPGPGLGRRCENSDRGRRCSICQKSSATSSLGPTSGVRWIPNPAREPQARRTMAACSCTWTRA